MIAHQRPNINEEGVFIFDDGKSSCMQTYSGKMVSLPFPKTEQIDIEDIADALSKQCRFNGHCSEFYSVAQHSTLGVKFLKRVGASKKVQREFLLHDATEAYLGDVIRPVKRLMPIFSELEDNFWGVISQKFDLPLVHSSLVHDVDNYMLVWEKRDLLPNSGVWPDLPDISNLNLPTLFPTSVEESKKDFLKLYEELFRGVEEVNE